MNITEFLEARIAEDEAAANNATGARWIVLPGVNASLVNIDARLIRDDKWKYGRLGHVATTSHDAAYADHIARQNPARVLAECAAKRAIIEQHKSWPVLVERKPSEIEQVAGAMDSITYRMTSEIAWLTTKEYIKRFGTEPPTAPIILTLAAIYKDHPDYQQEWEL